MRRFSDRSNFLEPSSHRFQAWWNVFVKKNSQVSPFSLDFTGVDPALDHRVPAKILRVDVEDSSPGYCSGRGCFEVGDFKHETHRWVERDSLVGGESQHLKRQLI